ncbi:MAG: cobyrinate a,c-diamide synthase [Rhizobiales bacterium]|nr:cobyrinate a,c-diamide synthase [Hyphomicrobiales bacterium]
MPPIGAICSIGTSRRCGRIPLAKAIVMAAPCSGSGKTLVTLGLLRAFRNRGLRVASAKAGPDYIDPRFHEAATGRPCFNLDPWAMDRAVIAGLMAELSRDTDLVIIEGVMGLFDGPQGAKGSTADLAQSLGLPVLLVVDARHQSQSIGALVHGFSTYRPNLRVAGVILNRVASDRHEAILRGALGEKIVGCLRHDDSLVLPSRHLGLVQAEENHDLEQFIESASLAVARETNLDTLLTIASPVPDESVMPSALPPFGQRIAVARDRAFTFAYSHLLHHWRRQGAQVMPFSPLADEAPAANADAIFLPGGYPELHAGKLAANHVFLKGIREAKCLVYGECGGFMVLGDGLIDAKGKSHAMAGLLPLTTSFAKAKLHLGYRQLAALGGTPWTKPLRGHEFHYSTIASEGKADRLFTAADASGTTLPPMGLRRGLVMGSYAHVISEAP